VQNPNGSVDVNGDGKSNGVFMGSQNIGLYDSAIQRKRQAPMRRSRWTLTTASS